MKNYIISWIYHVPNSNTVVGVYKAKNKKSKNKFIPFIKTLDMPK
jgi:hypothetical protein